ncbi:hypothetical protein [Comamonas sp.]|uniref:hypothetical protein n=1 Tax=Comamonas sp. TaxID=34028 RepID=UPI002587A32F|nr:hypothetical protein [Comamonas sp.]
MTQPVFSIEGLDSTLFDASAWPLVYGRFPELDEPDRVSRILNSLDAILALKQPFVVAWIPPSHDHDDEPHEDEKRSVMWIKQRKADLRQHCRGYLYITTDTALRALLEERLKTVNKMYGFPMRVVLSRQEAQEHLSKLMHP